MKKKKIIFVFIFFMLAFTAAYAAGEAEHNQAEPIILPTFRLPSSLISIEDEAFEGTSIAEAELPDTVQSIGRRAFAGISKLRFVRIPMNTKIIAPDAFTGSNRVTITAAQKSYARKWATENGTPFLPIATVSASSGTTITLTVERTYERIQEIRGQNSIFETDQKQNGHPENDSDIEPIIYQFIKQIQRRGPPIGKC